MKNQVFEKNKKALCLIPEIVLRYRRQFYFRGSKLLQELTELLQVILTELLEDKTATETKECLEILNALVQAQENQDYILIADILEGDLLPTLQKIQIRMESETEREECEYWEENIAAVRKVNPDLYREMQSWKAQGNSRYQVASAVTGAPIVGVQMQEKFFWMHSTLNPEWEGELLAESVAEEGVSCFYVLGMGLGYHVRALLERDKRNRVAVLESDAVVLELAFRYFSWKEELEKRRLIIVYDKEIASLLRRLQERKEPYTLMIHYPSIQCIENQQQRELLEDYFITASSMREQRNFLDENFYRLQSMSLPECGELRERLEGKNCLIVGGGPSVDEQLEEIRSNREKLIVIAVGTIARKLIKEEIRPDVIVITDPQEGMHRQIEGLDTKNIPLILLSTAAAEVADYYEGNVYLAYQKGYENAEKTAGERGYMTFETGGSVSTLAIDIAIRFGAKKIILSGMDMAYTKKRSHAAGTGRDIAEQIELRMVMSTEGILIPTSRNLDIYRKWIERRLKEADRPVVYNTGSGARIEGTYEVSLKEALEE